MIVAGLDEAGRGPILGPMVLCGVSFREGDLPALRRAGVRDSKLLSSKRRDELAGIIGKLALRIEIVELHPWRLDELRKHKNLNEIEAEIFSTILNRLKPDEAYIDSPDPRPELFERRITRYLKVKTRIVAQNLADRKFVQVSAASILAKQRRESRMEELRQKYGDCGSGYLTDAKTVQFLREWIDRYSKLPPFARHSWKWGPYLQRK